MFQGEGKGDFGEKAVRNLTGSLVSDPNPAQVKGVRPSYL